MNVNFISFWEWMWQCTVSQNACLDSDCIYYTCISYCTANCKLTQTTAHSEDGFRLAWRSPHCRYAAWSLLAVLELQLSRVTPLWLFPRAASLSWVTPLWLFPRAASLSCWIEVNCLRSAAVGKAAGYRLIGSPMLTTWSSLCSKRRLHSWTNIIIKMAMRRAAS